MGRHSFEIKICACPGRDRSTDENKFLKHKKNAAEKLPAKTNSVKLVSFKQKKNSSLNLEENDETTFTLVVKGRKNYEILKNLNEALRIQELYNKIKNNDSQLGQSIISNSFLAKKNSEITKRKNESINTLEDFLESIDMSAYYNIINSKGIKDLSSLLSANKKKLNSFKISKSDTNKLWDSIQIFKINQKTVSNKKIKSINSESFNTIANFDFNQSNLITESFLNPNSEKYIRLSKYQVKYTPSDN